MKTMMMNHLFVRMIALLAVCGLSSVARSQDLPVRQDDSVPAQAELIYERGLQYLAKSQNEKGNWNDSVGVAVQLARMVIPRMC